MAINTDVYGAKSSWDYTANTGNTGDPDTSTYILHYTLFNYSGTPSGSAIDKSLACSGLGTESCWSHLKFYDTTNTATIGAGGGGFADPDIIENRIVTNWCFSSSLGTFSGSTPTQQFAVIVDGNSIPAGTATNPENSRFAPSPVVSTYNTRYNPSDIKPITQFCHKNIVACIYVRAFDSPFSDYITADLHTYINNYSSSYPRIRCVYIKLFTDYGQSTRGAIQGLNYLNISILDNIQLPVTAPYMYGLVTEDDSNGVKIKVMGSICNAGGYFDTKGSIDSNIKTYIGMCAPDTWVLRVDGGRVDDYSYPMTSWGAIYRDYDETFFDECLEQVACFGLLFTDRESVALNGTITDPNMYCGVLDENLIGHGDYTQGTENNDNEQLNWTNSNDSTYDPAFIPDVDPNDYDNTSGFNSHLNAPTGFNKRYVLSEGDIRDLNSDFYQALNSKPSDIDYINYSMSEFLTNNPIEAIVSLKWFPFSVPTYGSAVTINLGNYSTSVSAPVYTGSGVESYEIGSFELYPYFGNTFLDYDPYSKTSIVIPYCGTVELDHSVCMGKTISVHMTVDIYTGACTAYIKADGLVIDSVSGVCCVDLPVTGIDNATLEGQIYNASLNLKSSKITEGTTIASSGLSFGSSLMGTLKGSTAKRIKGAINSVSSLVDSIENVNQSTRNLAQNEYNVSHVQIPIKSIGAQSGIGNAKQEQFCRVLYIRPVFLNGSSDLATWYNSADSATYGHTVGYACIKQGALSEFSGFTVCSNVDLSGVPATDSEKEQILKLLQSGVYL